MTRAALLALTAVLGLLAGSNEQVADDGGAKGKIELIRQDRALPGSVVRLTEEELNRYVRGEVERFVPEGIRDPRLDLGRNRASGYAYIDFPKLRQSIGKPMGSFLARLLSGARPVRVDARIRSGNGRAVIYLDRVEVSGLSISGGALDYLIRNFLWPYYPEAKIGKPFELAHGIDRLEVRPNAVRVVMAK